jgi:hypothetical protein
MATEKAAGFPDVGAEMQWQEVIERRSREMTEGQIDARSEEEMIRAIQDKLAACHPLS